MSETEPLLQQMLPKGRCWCCWESDENQSNPLIRVCLGCKDKDLQYIHQQCINKYISSLPERAVEYEDPPVQDHHESVDIFDFLSTAPTPQQEMVPKPKYYCTRCKTPYKIVESPIHPLRILLKDTFLWTSMGLMGICMTVLSICCFLLIKEHWIDQKTLFQFGPVWLRIRISTFALCMLVFCHSIHIGTWLMVLDHCKGSTEKTVVGIDEQLLLQQQGQDQEGEERRLLEDIV